MGWVTLQHKDTGGTTRVPDDEAVIAWHGARGWEPAPDAPERPLAAALAPASTGEQWIRLRHTVTDNVHEFPNDPTVIAHHAELGWIPDPGETVPAEPPAQQEQEEPPAAVGKTSKGAKS